MTDIPAPFSPFTSGPPPAPTSPAGGQVFEQPGKKPRKPAKGRGKKPAKGRAKPTRKGRKPKNNLAAQVATLGADSLLPPEKVPTRRKARKPRPTMIPIGILPALGGLQEVETSMLMSIIGNMQDVPKKSRAKIVAALAKAFA